MFNKLFRRFVVFYKLVVGRKSYLSTTGWFESLKRGRPSKPDGSEIPWMNFQIVSFLEDRLKSDFTFFEYGSGFSTRFWADRVDHVTSVEYDENWYKAVRNKIPQNVTLLYRKDDSDGAYCRTISETEERYDVVIVDGRDRVNCVEQSLHALTDRGVIVLDDSQREKYHEAITIARVNGFRALDFEGLKPAEFTNHRTTILYRDNNCLGI